MEADGGGICPRGKCPDAGVYRAANTTTGCGPTVDSTRSAEAENHKNAPRAECAVGSGCMAAIIGCYAGRSPVVACPGRQRTSGGGRQTLCPTDSRQFDQRPPTHRLTPTLATDRRRADVLLPGVSNCCHRRSSHASTRCSRYSRTYSLAVFFSVRRARRRRITKNKMHVPSVNHLL